ncbi:hypothetical protein RA2_04329 [Roseovarius sp. A-2]|nr:hypothetical protein RA2_04329 [Roseovarius sp. A-2]
MGHKIATCNYCGTRAALVLDRDRHELACASCGAPLHDMKAMPKAKLERHRIKARPTPQPRQDYSDDLPPARVPRPRKRRKGLSRRIFEEIWDVVEDIFD